MRKIFSIILVLVAGLSSCKKDFLDKKPDKALLVPTNLADFRALLDNTTIMNVVPGLQRISTDELWVTDAGLNAYPATQKNAYLWEKDIYGGASSNDWNYPYREIFYANIVLDGLKDLDISDNDKSEFNEIKGSAFFHRAFAGFHLAQLFAKPFTENSSNSDLGIPIPLESNVNKKVSRENLNRTYKQIISDLEKAVDLLPMQASYKSRPSKLATWALLARIYLSMGDYPSAGLYSDKVLKAYDKLLDYKTLSIASTTPFPVSLPNGNDEVLYHAVIISYSFSSSSVTGYDRNFYNLYSDNDLRKAMFFTINANGVVRPKNSYSGAFGTFAGIANDEVYLISAECYARNGETEKSMTILNDLLKKRWKANEFIPLTASNSEDALRTIILERNKELITNKGVLRWMDLRRLNLDKRFAVTIKRTVGSQVYTLLPNDPRYVFPIPDNEINSSGIEQNIR